MTVIDQPTDLSPAAGPAIAERVGCHYRPPHDYEIGREQIREFARSVHDEHPAHRLEIAAAALGYNTLIAPVTFVSVIGTRLLPELFEHLLIGYSVSDVLHTDQQILLRRPLQVGDCVSSDLCLESFRQSSGSDVMVTCTTLTDQRGNEVAVTRTTFVARTGGYTDPEIADALHNLMRS
ncbi:MAG: FAS1-like dehydratase domain-containing protein [Rhodococcus sp. (in: high G+C Gram-positive bacteria)]